MPRGKNKPNPPPQFLELGGRNLKKKKKKKKKKNDLPRKKREHTTSSSATCQAYTQFHHNKQAAHNITPSIDTKQERHESINKRGMWFFFFCLQLNNILNNWRWFRRFEVNVTTEGDAFAGNDCATISQHFSLPPPEFADFYLTTFAHSHSFFFLSSQYSSRDGEPLQGV